ncbi:MAG: ABC transporter ATP-binding protein [Trueperaceae bacterium]
MFRRSLPSSEARGKIDLKQLRRLFAYTKPYRPQLVIGILAVVIAGSLGLVFPIITGNLFNTAFAGTDAEGVFSQNLNRIGLLLIGIFIVQALFNYLRVYMLAQVGEGVVADLRKSLFKHLLGLPVRFFESRKTGEITSRLTSDIGTVQGAVSQSLAEFVNQSMTLLGGVVILFVKNVQLTLVMLSILPAVILAGAYFGRRLRKISTVYQDKIAEANASAEEAITGIRVVKSFTAEGLEQTRYANTIADSYGIALQRARVRAVFIPTIIGAMFIGISIVLWYGSRLIQSGDLLWGDFIAFVMLTILVAGSIGGLTGLYSQLQEAIGASRRIFELLDTTSDLPEATSPNVLNTVGGRVAFEHVSFRYGDRGESWVLQDVSLEAKPGEVIALVGPSGAGKSTLITLLPRFYDPITGRILLDGVDIKELSLENLRGNIGIVPQETQLFSGTIADNIRYGRQNATDTEVIEAARAANAQDFIEGFPDSYKTIVGERGVKLSGGQRQRVAIARALLKNPRILILDEATSSLDSESESLVQEALETLMQGRTTFVIAHRLSTIRNADRILVLERGKIVEQGTHQELLHRAGLYKELHDKQFMQEATLN